MDLLYILLTIAFFALTWAIVKLCDSLSGNQGEQQ